MHITHLKIANYRALREIDIPLSNFACIIGENNAGKSCLLQSLSLFRSGSTLTARDYFDPAQDIRIAVTFTGIGDADLNRLAEEHRGRISDICTDGTITLVRRYGRDGKSRLLYEKLCPIDERFREGYIAELVGGQRPGAEFVRRITAAFPELEGQVSNGTTQGQARNQINVLASQLPLGQMEVADTSLPTGFDKSIDSLLPEVIYIPAVKDLADETKTKESTPFGKILALLLKAIESKLADEQGLFEQLKAKLNHVIREDGTVHDGRLPEVQRIERTVQQFLQESFSNVQLRLHIPPPEIKSILSGAQIFANDGVEGLVDTKGDGLRRAVVFSIMRTYVELNKVDFRANDDAADHGEIAPDPCLLLFEEPELYLHPKAQQILFGALRSFSRCHHVVVTTHSPLFLGPDATTTFIKLAKRTDAMIADKPFTMSCHIDLTDMEAKDQFQLICYENNNAAFFSDTVVLVEGDSDYLVLPHVARIINPEWDCQRATLSFVRINGKTSIKRYRDFFSRFGVRVPVVSDLDLLVGGFSTINPTSELSNMRSQLLGLVDRVADERGLAPTPNGEDIAEARRSGSLRAQWARVRERFSAFSAQEATFEELDTALTEWFTWVRRDIRLEVLCADDDPRVLELKRQFLARLREQDIYVLERGAIEEYYPEGISGNGKPARAQCFCNTVTTRDAMLAICADITVGEGQTEKELELICRCIFTPRAVTPSPVIV